MMKKTMKKIIASALAVVLASGSLVGCSNSTTSTATETSKADSAQEAATEVKTDMVFATSAEPNSLDPMAIAMMSTFTITYAIYDNLVQMGEDGTYQPALAEEIIISDDELTYTFPIRKDVKFHDGTTLTPEDVKFSLERTIEKGWAFDMTACIESVEVDGDSVVLTLHTPFGGMIGSLASPFFAVMSESYLTENGDDIAKREPMGTGAYKFTEWVSGDYITVVANEDYWAGAPAIKNVTFKPITDKNTGLIALQNEEIDAFLNINAIDIETVKSNDKLSFYETDLAAVLSLSMNIESDALSDEKVRQAISYAVNRENIILGALEGIGDPANSQIPTVCDGYSAEVTANEYDPEEAKALLAEAGYDALTITMKIKEDSKNQKVAQILQADLKAANIDLEIEVMEAGAYTTDIYANGTYEVTLNAWCAMFLDAYSLMYSQFHKDCYGPTGNITHVTTDELSGLLEEAAQKTGDEKIAAYNAVCDNIKENAYSIPLVYEKTTITTNANLAGVEADALGVYQIKNFSWK